MKDEYEFKKTSLICSPLQYFCMLAFALLRLAADLAHSDRRSRGQKATSSSAVFTYNF